MSARCRCLEFGTKRPQVQILSPRPARSRRSEPQSLPLRPHRQERRWLAASPLRALSSFGGLARLIRDHLSGICQTLRHQVRRPGRGVVEDVGIEVQRHARRAVSQQALHRREIARSCEARPWPPCAASRAAVARHGRSARTPPSSHHPDASDANPTGRREARGRAARMRDR